jgi:hypothetical protein
VRKKQTKVITLNNTSVNTWRVKPVFDNDLWSCSKSAMKLTTGQSVTLDIVYNPQSMTGEKMEHKGTVFLATPDGGGEVKV